MCCTLSFQCGALQIYEGDAQFAKLMLMATADKRAKEVGKETGTWLAGVALQTLFVVLSISFLAYVPATVKHELRLGRQHIVSHQQWLQCPVHQGQAGSPVVLQHGHHKGNEKKDGHDEGSGALGLLNLCLGLVGPLPLI